MKKEYRKTVRHFNDFRHAHFLTFSCNKNLPLLNKERSCLWFLESLELSCKKHDYVVVAFVIMPNHVHLLLSSKKHPYSIADFLKSLKQSVARKAKRFLAENNHEWLEKLSVGDCQKRFAFWLPGPGYDRNIYSPEELEEKVKYIHNNPVRKGLSSSAEEWRWSSARQYAGCTDNDFSVETVFHQ